MAQIATSIEIAASPATVWEILADFPSYPSWNPFVKSIAGSKEPGARLDVTLQPAGGRATTLKPRLLVCDAPREFRWKGQLGIPGIFDGEHSFQLSSLGSGKTLFRHGEKFTGLLVPFVFRGALKRATERGFEAMNRALKLRAESRSAA
jgi:hypothetical protein